MSLKVDSSVQMPMSPPAKGSLLCGTRRGSGIYLSGVSAAPDGIGGFSPAAGNMAEQASAAYRKVLAGLHAAGSSIQAVTKVIEYIAASAYQEYPEVDAARTEAFGRHRPAVNTVFVNRLANPQALIEIEITADTDGRSLSSGHGLLEANGLVYLSTVLPLDDHGNIVAPGDLVGQTRAIFQRAKRILSSVGLGMDHIVMTIDHPIAAARKDYKRSEEVRREFLGPVFPGAAGIIMSHMMHPEAMIQYEFIAARAKPQLINPGWSRYDALTYSPAVRVGDFLFMSGLSARDQVDLQMRSVGDVVGQAEFIYGKVRTLIEFAGGKANDLVRTVEYVTPKSVVGYQSVIDVRRQLFPDPEPAATGVVCEMLLRRDMEIEIIPFAVLNGPRK